MQIPNKLSKNIFTILTSQNSNILFSSIPKFFTSVALVDKATKCLATCKG